MAELCDDGHCACVQFGCCECGWDPRTELVRLREGLEDGRGEGRDATEVAVKQLLHFEEQGDETFLEALARRVGDLQASEAELVSKSLRQENERLQRERDGLWSTMTDDGERVWDPASAKPLELVAELRTLAEDGFSSSGRADAFAEAATRIEECLGEIERLQELAEARLTDRLRVAAERDELRKENHDLVVALSGTTSDAEVERLRDEIERLCAESVGLAREVRRLDRLVLESDDC